MPGFHESGKKTPFSSSGTLHTVNIDPYQQGREYHRLSTILYLYTIYNRPGIDDADILPTMPGHPRHFAGTGGNDRRVAANFSFTETRVVPTIKT